MSLKNNMSERLQLLAPKLLVFLCILFVFLNALNNINANIVGVDAGENIVLTQSLVLHEQFSLKDKFNNGALYPSNFREPLPIFFWAQSLNFFSSVNDKKLESKLNHPDILITAKYANVLFLAILLVTIPIIVLNFPEYEASDWSKSIISIGIILLLQWYGFVAKVNAFSNDLHTGALLCLLILFCIYYFLKPTFLKLISIGLTYGLICLTKATFFYSGIIVFILVIPYQFIHKLNVKTTLIVLISALIVTAPWIARNYIQTGQTAISGRGPETFVDRTYEEIYNDKHFIGLWYAYSPDFLKPLATKLTGYGFEDRLKGGRLQHSTRAHIHDHKARELLDDAMAINSHFKACIWMRKIYNNFYDQTKDPIKSIQLANVEYKKFALNQVIEHPLRHLKFSIIFAWRGIWILNAIDGRTPYEMGLAKQESLMKQLTPFLGFFSLIVLFVYGFIKKNKLLITLTIFPIAAYAFNSFFSHNLPRYGEQFLPVWFLALGFALLALKSKLQKYFFI